VPINTYYFPSDPGREVERIFECCTLYMGIYLQYTYIWAHGVTNRQAPMEQGAKTRPIYRSMRCESLRSNRGMTPSSSRRSLPLPGTDALIRPPLSRSEETPTKIEVKMASAEPARSVPGRTCLSVCLSVLGRFGRTGFHFAKESRAHVGVAAAVPVLDAYHAVSKTGRVRWPQT
jgi:hypothetical protein